MAYFAIGDPGKVPAQGGMPYSQKPSGIRFYYKSNIIGNDTAFVLASFKKAGTTLGTYFFKVSSSKSVYTLFTSSLSPALTTNPDSLVIAAASSNAFGSGPANPGNFLQIDSISFTGVSSQPAGMNSSFENWVTFQDEKLNGISTSGSVRRTTDMFNGSYAAELQTTLPSFGGGGVRSAVLQTAQPTSSSTVRGGLPYSAMNDTISLYYKYLPADPLDYGRFFVWVKKAGVVIWQNSASLTLSASYKKVNIPLTHTLTPDTIGISIESSNYPYLNSYVGSDLKIDNMYLASQKLPICSFVSPTVGCTGQSIQLTDNSGNGANAWGWIMPGGNPGSSTAQNPTVIYNSPGTKTITMISNNAFGAGTPTTRTINIFAVPNVTSTSTITACGGGNAILTASGASTYTWSTGATTSTIIVTPSVTTIYTVAGTSNGCVDYALGAVIVPLVPKPDICMVTVDSLNKFNEIYWDKTAYPNLDSMIIYREVISNTYRRIGAVSKNALSMWVDTARSIGPANGDPNISTYRYKIQVRDTCGQYGPKSLWHNTVYFTHSAGTFFWTNNYLIEGPTNPVLTYSLMVNITPTVATSTYSLVGTTTGNQSTLNDPFYVFYQNTADWRVEADLGYACTATQKTSVTKSTKSRSNIQNNRTAIGINEIQFKNKFRVYPNPSSGIINIESMAMDEETNLIVRNVLGQEVYSDKIMKGTTAKTVNLSAFAKGIYSMELSNGNNKAIYKLVTE
ncbi:MAG: T9SS type A sorting domain-containing protein [Sphingobacteriaceae bacterium]|nr:T9SS type A sorting domain-containing protein [Sphingobacteriaceae bacterium]